jgi:ferritin-like metal-binding protein YciE
MDKAEKNWKKSKALDELKELNDKIQNEELLTKLDKFKQNSKNQTKNLEQLVELTKRFYVERKPNNYGTN